jgi:pantoate--beta-alanine ligase
MQHQSDEWRRENRRIAFVATMGYLHEGHLALVRKALEMGDVVVVSIFVNPAQFGPSEDFDKYPRDVERDMNLCAQAGADVVFAPKTVEMYPEGYQTFVNVTEVTRPLCGKSRPTFFRGVATVVAKLFHIIKPHVSIFGEKDYQQLLTIRRMVRDLNMDIEIVGHPLVREHDGLAMSSRNAYLTAEQRSKALMLSESLTDAQRMVREGERRAEVILERVKEKLSTEKDIQLDYAELRHPETLEEVERLDGPALLALGAYLGHVRLIDNCMLG